MLPQEVTPMNLVACSECQRHVKADAIVRGEACPFCGAVASAEAQRAAMSPAHASTSRDRSVLLFGAAAVASAFAVAACGRESDGGNGLVMPYGAPITVTPDASMFETPKDAGVTPKDAGTSSMPQVVPAYGAPPPLPPAKK
jgi:hypothetical protein